MAETKSSASSNWTATQAYVLATVCLLAGVAVGYLARGSAMGSGNAPAAKAQATGAPSGMGGAAQTGTMQPTPEQMRHMAETQAAPLLAQLKSEPDDVDLLYKVGNVYYDVQQFPEAATYYEKAVTIDPSRTDVRTDLGTAYHYMGQPDRALKEYDEVLKIDDKNVNALFNQGMVRWQGKMDTQGAIASWRRLLATNPTLSKEKRDQVQQLIVKAQEHLTMKPGTKTDQPAEMPSR